MANKRPVVRRWGSVLESAWGFYVTPWYSLPIALTVFLLKDRWIILGGVMMACALTYSLSYPFFFPHYLAAYSCVIMFLILRGMMTLFQWSCRGWAVGPLAVLFLMFGGSIMGLRAVTPKKLLGLGRNASKASLRVQVSDQLLRLQGRHVVFVRYDATHSFHDEWVYNAANVDAAPIVWCRASEPADAAEVTRYYKDRHFWTAIVGEDRVRVSRYNPAVQPSASAESSEGESGTWVFEQEPGSKE